MSKQSISYTKVKRNGKIIPIDDESLNKETFFEQDIKDGELVEYKAKRLSSRDTEYSHELRYHFAYIDKVLEHGHERFTQQYEDKEDLHYELKKIYCERNPEFYQGKKQRVFSCAVDSRDLTDEQYKDFFMWCKKVINENHLKEFGYEIPYWQE